MISRLPRRLPLRWRPPANPSHLCRHHGSRSAHLSPLFWMLHIDLTRSSSPTRAHRLPSYGLGDGGGPLRRRVCECVPGYPVGGGAMPRPMAWSGLGAGRAVVPTLWRRVVVVLCCSRCCSFSFSFPPCTCPLATLVTIGPAPSSYACLTVALLGF
jgi:hypothetical protein